MRDFWRWSVTYPRFGSDNGGRHRIQSLSTNSCFDEVKLESHNVANRSSPLLSSPAQSLVFFFLFLVFCIRGVPTISENSDSHRHELSETWVTYKKREDVAEPREKERNYVMRSLLLREVWIHCMRVKFLVCISDFFPAYSLSRARDMAIHIYILYNIIFIIPHLLLL